MSAIRCAVYTRKSSEEGLEQSFNSLDAQREACLAFIQSQRHEGWQAVHTRYDDGGFSGGNMDRPALKRLMADIGEGKINTVVVYKVDRLTRSLADFAKIIEQFDAMQVSFVSVTQQFNTTTSMGRLTLNVLLSFAQFEREVTGERIRDKIAASKKKGMWMGGYVPLGYDLRDRKIYINRREAETIGTIYSNYLRLGYVQALQRYLDQEGITSKPRTLRNGTKTGGTRFSRGALYKILRNPIYAGDIAHKGTTYKGDHEGIINRKEWDQVQDLLTENRQGQPRKARSTKPSLFTGIIFDSAGNRYTPTHTNKRGRRYRYYTSQAAIRKADSSVSTAARIPAHELETKIADRIFEFLRTPRELLKAIKHDPNGASRMQYSHLFKTAVEKAASIARQSSQLRDRFVMNLVDRVIIHADSVEALIRTDRLFQELDGTPSGDSARYQARFSLFCPFHGLARRRAVRLMVSDKPDSAQSQCPEIIKAIAQALKWKEQLISGEAHGIKHLARVNRCRVTHVREVLPLASLSPANIEAIMEGHGSPNLSLDSFVCGIPLVWMNQGPDVIGLQ